MPINVLRNHTDFTLIVDNQHHTLIAYDLLLKKGFFTTDSTPPKHINGIVSAFKDHGPCQASYCYTLMMKPALSKLAEDYRKDYYVQTNLKTIRNTLLNQYRLLNVSYRFKNKQDF